jgi:hypothetical protein
MCIVAVLCSVLCIYVIYKCLSLVLWSVARSVQAKLKIAKQSYRRGKQLKHLKSCGKQEDSFCFERGARMDSFAAVLTTPSFSSMYTWTVWIVNKKIILVCNDYSNDNYVSDWPIFFIQRLKINHKTRLGICICSWVRHCHEH